MDRTGQWDVFLVVASIGGIGKVGYQFGGT